MDIDEIGKIEPKIDEVKVVKESESLFMTSNFKTEVIFEESKCNSTQN